jgi:hypothetical protein
LKFAGIFALLVGAGMLAQWGFFLITGQLPEVRTEPIRLAFHLAAEGLTALALVISGMGMLTRRAWGRTTSLIALGMLLYTAIVSPGYFAQQSGWAMVVLFALIFLGALISLFHLSRHKMDRE